MHNTAPVSSLQELKNLILAESRLLDSHLLIKNISTSAVLWNVPRRDKFINLLLPNDPYKHHEVSPLNLPNDP